MDPPQGPEGTTWMGNQLLRQVEALAMGGRLDGITNASKTVLFIMALNAHDKGTQTTPEACYFRGWAHIASAALGHRGLTPAGERAVARSISELTTAGLIKVDVDEAHKRRQQVYRLTLW